MNRVRGFALVELLLALSLTMVVVGAAVTVTGDVQRTQANALEDTAAQQEARYVIEWIARVVATAGSDPYATGQATGPPAAPTCGGVLFVAIRRDPDGNGVPDDLRVQADINPPNGVLVGDGVGDDAVCDESGEDVTIGIDRTERVITRRDLATDAGPVPVTDAVFTDLRFTYLTLARAPAATAADIAYVGIAVTAESRARNPVTGVPARFTYRREVRVRGS
jgi:type II secretory pathway pseudopilin PulG